jgi:hypothetical protein
MMKAARVWKTSLVVAEPLLPTTVADSSGNGWRGAVER